jgi:hypothetical protein
MDIVVKGTKYDRLAKTVIEYSSRINPSELFKIESIIAKRNPGKIAPDKIIENAIKRKTLDTKKTGLSNEPTIIARIEEINARLKEARIGSK